LLGPQKKKDCPFCSLEDGATPVGGTWFFLEKRDFTMRRMVRMLAAVLVAAPGVIAEGGTPRAAGSGGAGILYHPTENVVRSSGARGSGCRSMLFVRFLEAGIHRPDGSNRVLELRDYVTSKVTDLIDTRRLGHPSYRGWPVTILFAGWLTGM